MCISPTHQHKSINTAAVERAADPRVRRSARPLPHSPSTRDCERHPSSIIRLQRSERPAQVTTSPKTEREKERRTHTTPSQRGEGASPGRELCLWCFPVSTQVTTPQTHPLPGSPPSTPVARLAPSSKQAPACCPVAPAAPPAPHRTWTSLAGLASAAQGAVAGARGGGALRDPLLRR